MTSRREEVRRRIREAMSELDDAEKHLLNRVLQIEQENLHMTRPRVKEDLLKAVRDTIK